MMTKLSAPDFQLNETPKESAPSFCWHCGRRLVRKKGGFYFGRVVDPAGNEHRVHKDCVDEALGDGVKKA